MVFFWGTISTLQSVCTSWAGLMACRFLLGMAETMFGPGIPLYLSFFYPREYMGVRFGVFLSGSALANAYGGALAYGLSHIDSSISNWRFLFIIEGVPTALLAAVCWFFLPDSPGTARFLSEKEREIAVALSRSQPGDNRDAGLDLKHLGTAFKDYRSESWPSRYLPVYTYIPFLSFSLTDTSASADWMFALSNFSTNVSFASLPLFLPTIISEMGAFSTLTSNGLSAPPCLLSFSAIIASAFLCDRLRVRGPVAAAFASVAAAGYLVLALTSDVAPRYTGVFLVVLVFVTVAVVLVWNANTNETDSKRAGGVWIIQTVGQCGTLLGTNLFPAGEEPYYRRGMWIGFAFSMLSACICATLSFLLWRENRRRDRLYGKTSPDQPRDVELPLEASVRYFI